MRSLLLVPLLLLAACDSNGSNGDLDPVSPGPISGFDFRDGTRWTYTSRFEQYGPRAGSAEPDTLVFAAVDTVTVVARRDVSLGEEDGLLLLETSTQRGVAVREWYRESDSTLVLVAQGHIRENGTPWTTPLAPSPDQGADSDARRGGECGTMEDGLEYCFRTALVYAYPLAVGQSWEVWSLEQVAFRRSVTATGETTTPAGTFGTVEVLNDWSDYDNEVCEEDQVDHVAREGLVRRERIWTCSQIITEEGDLVDGFRDVNRVELIRLERP